MGAQRFTTGKRFIWHGKSYRVQRVYPNADVDIVDVQSGTLQKIAIAKLTSELFAERLEFINDTNDEPFTPTYTDIADCPPHLREIAEFRLDAIRPLLNIPRRTKEGVAKRVQEILLEHADEDNPAISVSSVYRWMQDYNNAGGDIRALIPDYERRGGSGQTRLEQSVEAIIQAVIEDHFLVPETVTIEDVYHETVLRIHEENQYRHDHEQLEIPSMRTISRRINDLNAQTRIKIKLGSQVARTELRQFGQMDYPDKLLARVEIDHTRLDVIVVDENDGYALGRPTITFALDTASRYPLGLYVGFEPPSYLTVMQCLLHAIQPKGDTKSQYGTEHQWIAYGLPSVLVIDNGKEFIGSDLADACNSLGIAIEQNPVKMPWFKAAIERAFGSLNTGVVHGIQGTTFSNPVQRGDYDSVQKATITLDELSRILTIFLIDIYAERFHTGLDGIPARYWEKAIASGFSPRLPTSNQDLEILLARTERRVIHRYGIELFSLRYNSPELASVRLALRDKKDRRVKIKWNPADLSYIHLYDPTSGQYIRIPALAEEYATGLTIWKHKVIRQRVLKEKGDVDLVALGQAKRKIQNIVDKSKDRKTGSRSKIGRWQTGGQSPNQPSSQDKKGDDVSPTITDIDINLDELDDADEWGITYG